MTFSWQVSCICSSTHTVLNSSIDLPKSADCVKTRNEWAHAYIITHTYTRIYIYISRGNIELHGFRCFCIGSGQRESNSKLCHERPVSVRTQKTDPNRSRRPKRGANERNEDDGKMCTIYSESIQRTFRAVLCLLILLVMLDPVSILQIRLRFQSFHCF